MPSAGSSIWPIWLLRLAALLVAVAASGGAVALAMLRRAESSLTRTATIDPRSGDIAIFIVLACGATLVASLLAGHWWRVSRPADAAGDVAESAGRAGAHGLPSVRHVLRSALWSTVAGAGGDALFARLLLATRVAAAIVAVPAVVIAISLLQPSSGATARIDAYALTVGGWAGASALLAGSAALARLSTIVDEREQAVMFLRIGVPAAAPGRLAVLRAIGPSAAVAVAIGVILVTSAGREPETSCAADQECRLVTVALDRDDAAGDRTLGIVYRVFPAQNQRLGTIVVAVGGPGVSGIEEADARIEDIDLRIRQSYDIVFFDQRGVGRSGGLSCPDAVRTSQAATNGFAASPFATACIAELQIDPSSLPFYGTVPAAEDLEAIREQLDVDQFILYGESYGTRLAQVYAASHPDRLSGLILDGPVDLAASGLDFWSETAEGFAHALELVGQTCAADKGCAMDLSGRSPSAIFADLLGRARGNGLKASLPLPGGAHEDVLTESELTDVVAHSLYQPLDRMLVLRALAEATRGRYTLLARLVEFERSIPPQGARLAGSARYSTGFSTASYYAIECADYGYPAGGVGLDEFLSAADRADANGNPFSGIVLQDLPCTSWPTSGARHPDPTARPPVPTLVLASTADPVTPPANAERIVERLPSARLVLTDGGPHVTWRAEATCVRDAVEGFLRHAFGRTGDPLTCTSPVIERYVPILPDRLDRARPLELFRDVAADLRALPELALWDGTGETDAGCAFGGSFFAHPDVSRPDNAPTVIVLSHCAVDADLTLDGSGTIDPVGGALHLSLTVDGGDLDLRIGGDGTTSLTGVFEGRSVDLHE